VNKKFLFDCGNPKGGWLKKAAWPGLKKQWPCAYEIFKKINLNNEHIAYAAALVDVDNLNYSQAAKRWMDEYPQVWKPWLNASCSHD
jgi:glycine betaine/proline transport system substrate-binding protein